MAFKPIFMKDVDLILGDEATGDNYKCQLRSVKLTPDTNIVKTKTMCPAGQFAETEDPEWTLELGYLYGQDDGSGTPAEALADYLLANKGEKSDFFFRPISGGKGYTGQVTLIAGGIGGDQGAFSEQTVSLPLDGQPVAVVAVVVAP